MKLHGAKFAKSYNNLSANSRKIKARRKNCLFWTFEKIKSDGFWLALFYVLICAMSQKIRLGIIGTGFARLTQIPAFKCFPDIEIVSLASARLENAEKVARQFEIPHWTNNWRETVERDDLDLISIVTPPNLHFEQTMLALETGKHVLCEKPTAMNASEAKQMWEKAQEKGVLNLIDFELRFLNGRGKAFEMLRNGDIGKVVHFKTLFRNASRGTPDLAWNWWADAAAGGGALGAIGSHMVDTFRWMLGTEITDIFCLLNTNIKERTDAEGVKRPVTSDDEANFILRFADSELTADASGTASMSVVESGKYDYYLEIFGTDGAIKVGEGGEVWISKMSDHDWTNIEIDLGEPPPNTKIGGWSRGFMNFAREIVCALREGKNSIEHAATFEDGYRCQIVLDAARESNEKGLMVKI
jgi:predicted dehydrogenase